MSSLAHRDLKNSIWSSEETLLKYADQLRIFQRWTSWAIWPSIYIHRFPYCYQYYDIKKFILFILVFKAHYFVFIFYMHRIVFLFSCKSFNYKIPEEKMTIQMTLLWGFRYNYVSWDYYIISCDISKGYLVQESTSYAFFIQLSNSSFIHFQKLAIAFVILAVISACLLNARKYYIYLFQPFITSSSLLPRLDYNHGWVGRLYISADVSNDVIETCDLGIHYLGFRVRNHVQGKCKGNLTLTLALTLDLIPNLKNLGREFQDHKFLWCHFWDLRGFRVYRMSFHSPVKMPDARLWMFLKIFAGKIFWKENWTTTLP